jgi:hypothetical protein
MPDAWMMHALCAADEEASTPAAVDEASEVAAVDQRAPQRRAAGSNKADAAGREQVKRAVAIAAAADVAAAASATAAATTRSSSAATSSGTEEEAAAVRWQHEAQHAGVSAAATAIPSAGWSDHPALQVGLGIAAKASNLLFSNTAHLLALRMNEGLACILMYVGHRHADGMIW